MRRHLVLGLAVVAIAALAAGCGGSSRNKAYTASKADFAAAMSSICAAANKKIVKDNKHKKVDGISEIRDARPVTADELAIGIAALTRGYAKNFETFDQVARAIAQLSLFDLPESFYSEFVPRIEALTPDDVSRAAARHLDPSRLTTLVVGDVDVTSQEFGSLNLGAPNLVVADSI